MTDGPPDEHEDVPPRGGLLAVHAHPDDETLSNGALLATWAGAGLPTTVVTCTRGEQGEVIPPALRHLEGDGPALAAHREGELAVALAALGVTDHVFLDAVHPSDVAHRRRFVDSGMAWAAAGRATTADDVAADAFARVDLDDAAARLAAVLRDRRPAVVVGYEPGGGYGHPDHVRAHEVLHRAVDLAAAPALAGEEVGGRPEAGRDVGGWDVPVVLWTVVPEGPWRAGLAQLRAGGAAEDAGLTVAQDAERPSAVVPGPVDLVVDVAPVLDQVLAALAAHATQVHALGREPAPASGGRAAVARYALSNDVLQPLLAQEAYVLARGRVADVGWPDGVAPPATPVA
ncbi:PIG-L family deacetylase [Actinotalea sp. Marseille-Q4924]|uniref:PIG-L family deacetylase n=1 Tax=Actinotalea sp. Marseille-Q4924 TaxID=2866571 RepID=UPI001CE4664B|nr:PIG-L family deacetylase [Actinotalea sp. Marseille-Q4924]